MFISLGIRMSTLLPVTSSKLLPKRSLGRAKTFERRRRRARMSRKRLFDEKPCQYSKQFLDTAKIKWWKVNPLFYLPRWCHCERYCVYRWCQGKLFVQILYYKHAMWTRQAWTKQTSAAIELLQWMNTSITRKTSADRAKWKNDGDPHRRHEALVSLRARSF